MEASSPLAAMQPPSLMPMWGGKGLYNPHTNHNLPGASRFGPGAFNFRDLSMKRSSGEYFALKPIRGSSPTASLAADLSQNFHIDMSPQLPTPRRSLFTSNLFGTIDGRENTTTPPLPSSSPGPLHERMDISPLPHKAPFGVQVEIQSPTPQSTPQLDEDVMPSSPPQQEYREAPRPIERRKSILARPSLSRAKGYSLGSIPTRTGHENQMPPFRFGAGSSKLSNSTSMTLDECFMESPPHERRPQSANSPCAPITGASRLKQPFSSMAGNAIRNGSPMAAHSRRPSNPFIRPRKQYRRSLSMFENPADMMRQKKEDVCAQSTLQAVMDIDDPHIPVLPHFFQEGQPDSIPRIAKSTLLEVLDGKYNENYAHRMVVDCRFEYEYEGGHIHGAVNYNDKESLTSQLFESNLSGKTLLIFHCEYSAHRAPLMARHIRQQDRTNNAEHYPRLTFPEVYILDGGYSAFYLDHRDRCYPQNYVEMAAKEHASTCEREMGRLKQSRKLSRAQTFAFGQHGNQMDDSPTTSGRRARDDVNMIGDSSPMLDDRVPARRMASY